MLPSRAVGMKVNTSCQFGSCTRKPPQLEWELHHIDSPSVIRIHESLNWDDLQPFQHGEEDGSRGSVLDGTYL